MIWLRALICRIIDHDWWPFVTDADGNTEHECRRCGDTYILLGRPLP